MTKGDKWWIVLGVAFVLALFGGGGFALWRYLSRFAERDLAPIAAAAVNDVLAGKGDAVLDRAAPGFLDDGASERWEHEGERLRARFPGVGPVKLHHFRSISRSSTGSRTTARLRCRMTIGDEEIGTDLGFQQIDGQWRLLGIDLDVPEQGGRAVAFHFGKFPRSR